MAQQQEAYPVQFTVDYPVRPLDRFSTFFRLVAIIPIFVILTLVSSGSLDISAGDRGDTNVTTGLVGGLVVLAPVLMLLFRHKYPRWWFDWNLGLMKFGNRVGAYLFLMRDEYPSTDEEQAVHLEVPYPEVKRDLSRWLPLLKWLLAIPHYIVLAMLFVIAIGATIVAWFAILFTGRYPRSIFHFVESTLRWANRVAAYAFLLATDKYPPFRLNP